MSEGGSIKARLTKAEAKHEENVKAYMEAQLPPPRRLYRMNDDEFMHHVMTLVFERIIREKLGMSEDELKLMITEVWNQEEATLLEQAKTMRQQQLLNELTKGIRGIDPNGTKLP